MSYVIFKLDCPDDVTFTQDHAPYLSDADAGLLVIVDVGMGRRYYRGRWSTCRVQLARERIIQKRLSTEHFLIMLFLGGVVGFLVFLVGLANMPGWAAGLLGYYVFVVGAMIAWKVAHVPIDEGRPQDGGS